MVRRAFPVLLVALAGLATACSAGGVSTFAGVSGATAARTAHIVELNLTKDRPVSTPYGEGGGIKPPVLVVRVGDTIVFKNSDTFEHTSSSLGNFKKFPAGSPLTAKALKQHGATAFWWMEQRFVNARPLLAKDPSG